MKGLLLVVKVGIKVKNIWLVEGDYDIDCKIDGIGVMKLKLEFVKKVWLGIGCDTSARIDLIRALVLNWKEIIWFIVLFLVFVNSCYIVL